MSIDPHYLSEDLLQDLLNTDFPDQVQQFRNVTPLLRIFLPSGALLDDTGDSIVILIIEEYNVWEEMERARDMKWKGADGTQVTNLVLEYMNGFKESGAKQCRFVVHAITEHGAAFRAPIEEEDAVLEPLQGIQYICNGQVEEILNALKRIGLNLLLLLQSYPEYITIAAPFNTKNSHGQGFGSSGRPKLLQPRCIGPDLNTRLEDDSTSVGQYGSTNKKSTHLRRGHWRRQRTGSGLRGHRFIWIKPIVINPN